VNAVAQGVVSAARGARAAGDAGIAGARHGGLLVTGSSAAAVTGGDLGEATTGHLARRGGGAEARVGAAARGAGLGYRERGRQSNTAARQGCGRGAGRWRPGRPVAGRDKGKPSERQPDYLLHYYSVSLPASFRNGSRVALDHKAHKAAAAPPAAARAGATASRSGGARPWRPPRSRRRPPPSGT